MNKYSIGLYLKPYSNIKLIIVSLIGNFLCLDPFPFTIMNFSFKLISTLFKLRTSLDLNPQPYPNVNINLAFQFILSVNNIFTFLTIARCV
ncbi:hypothetical protein Danklef1_65 [Polaribacter phage Danklef_1]|uniref:Uncharacterized protein n=1 Tax=Polaribacter phage Danklef_1 TaxID=2745646 RepID=A0A8E5EAW1_9CAUD|nr:hypothetical protein M1M23_gp65 [Polaribacter phage Danklef_1]QQV90625.1 hypothetical protein Danklef2_65 [Polaribacter phage Danklef_2]QQV90702.1 hypothetical protein Danklef3_66 [Polaribacter phage Danklef_3]QQV90779.1 hypothetical protein Danklef4_66 [Polaribacter phage Danklef_4]QQV90857.1 hypothetical protein Danklef5_67 [Polaribacter phage Danklef_5]QQV90549.1 hypothetical protein Danklef1_65 [Polaribacter phage Danklef_1]